MLEDHQSLEASSEPVSKSYPSRYEEHLSLRPQVRCGCHLRSKFYDRLMGLGLVLSNLSWDSLYLLQ